MPNSPRILLYDIETAPDIALVWSKYLDGSVASIEQDWYLISFAWKWLGDHGVKAVSLPQFKTYKKRPTDDRELCKKLWDLFQEADIVVAHNGASFDTKKANARFIINGFDPPSPYKQVDTKLEAKKTAKFDSNSVADLARQFGLGKKLKHEGIDLWRGVMAGNRKAWRTMVEYNKHDVVLLEGIYLKLRPWMKSHPNLNLYNDSNQLCPNCQHTKLIVRGYYRTLGGERQQLQCKKCGHYCARLVDSEKAVRQVGN